MFTILQNFKNIFSKIIKNMIFQKNTKFVQGVYTPINKNKFGGEIAIYRSSLELKLFKFLDLSKNVQYWHSENIVIPYQSPIDGRVHHYYVDNVVHIKEGDKIVKYLIEVKPYKQTLPPVPSTRKKKSTVIYEQVTYAVNQAKWKSARSWCTRKCSEGNNWKFQLITERELNII
jgi:hypothetical protein